MKKIKLCFLVIMIALVFMGCNKTPRSEEATQYNGKALNIGIIGEIPNITNQKIRFEEIQFTDLEKKSLSFEFDSVIITGKNIPDSTQTKFMPFCKNYKIPFFFINIEQSTTEDQTYAVGYLFSDNKNISWGYSLPDNIESEENIKDIYTKIFRDIEKNTKE